MKFVDAHIHLSDEEYSEHVDDVIADAKNSNVVALVSNSMDLETCIRSLKLAEKYQGIVFAALGIHPWNVKDLTDDELQKTVNFICEQRDNKGLIAIGEIGLDYKYANIWDKQLKVFNEMLLLAEKLGLPVIIHSRGTTSQIVEMLPSYKIKKVLLHWFSHPLSLLTKIVENGYYITEGPPTAYSNGIREVVRKIPLTSLLTETDGPVRYFKQPFNGQITTPAFIPMIVEAIAEIKNLEIARVAEQIIENFEKFFKIKVKKK
ncbi:MAG: TatD family hydrolase [Candidatus Bathyarchaeota archaeon]|jgi:TatD DNase family protein|nr:TatD family hydrolase [Candidatus Bathyarchaeota archaeon]